MENPLEVMRQKDLETFAGAIMLDPEFLAALYHARDNTDELKMVLELKGIEAAGDFAHALHSEQLDWDSWKKLYPTFEGVVAST
jgi:hypothetical protein